MKRILHYPIIFFFKILLNFILSLSVVLFLLLIQLYFRYQGLFLSNELPLSINAGFIISNLPWMLALAIPLSLLIMSVRYFDLFITFSKGIQSSSFTGALLPILLVLGLLSGFMFYFNSYQVPESNHTARLYRQSIKLFSNSKDSNNKFKLSTSGSRGDREMNMEQLYEKVELVIKNKYSMKKEILTHVNKLGFDNSQSSILINKLENNYVFNSSDIKWMNVSGFENDEESNKVIKYLNEKSLVYNAGQNSINKYYIEIHKKYSITAAIFILFLFGAFIGIGFKDKRFISIPAIGSIVFLHWALLIAGEKLSDKMLLSPFIGMWSANFLTMLALIPLGLLAKEKFYELQN